MSRVLWSKTGHDPTTGMMLGSFARAVFDCIHPMEGVSVTQMCDRWRHEFGDSMSRGRMYRALMQLERRGLLYGRARGGKSQLPAHAWIREAST